jgi:hypothetical protein
MRNNILSIYKINFSRFVFLLRMGFSLYSLIEAALLCVNAIAILSEQRFLSRCKLTIFQYSVCHFIIVSGSNQNPGDAKQQLLTLIRSVRTVMRGKINVRCLFK